MSANERLRIAIIGAGIGGLTLSAALGFMKDQGHVLEIDIYEAASHISEIGAGINFWPRTWNIMKSIGFEEELLGFLPQAPDDSTRKVVPVFAALRSAHTVQGLVFEVRKGDQPQGLYIQDIKRPGGAIRFHRADLQQTLISRMHGRLHFSHRFIGYEEHGEEIHLQFENGRAATCDLLVGMDGINSVVRKCFLLRQGLFDSPSLGPIWSGDTAYRAVIPTASLEAEFPGHRALTTPMMYWGKSKHAVVYPVSSGQSIHLVFFNFDPSKEGTIYDGPTASPCTQEELLSIFRGWEEEVLALIRCIQKPIKWIIRSMRPMEHYSFGPVVLGGDAAHAMTPHQGGGAAQAIEDSYILASLISDPTCSREKVPRICKIYSTIRSPKGNAVLEKSRKSGRIFQLMAPGFEDVEEGNMDVPLEKLVKLIEEVHKDLEHVWKESVEVDRLRALEMLRGLELS